MIILFLVGLLVRTGYIFVSKSYISPKDVEYGTIARNIVNGTGFARAIVPGEAVRLTSSHAPLYPLFLALFYQFGIKPTSFLIIQLIQALLSALVIVLSYKIALLIFSKKVAALTAFGVTFYPPFIYYCAKLVPTTFFLFLLSLTVFLILSFKRHNWPLNILTGVVFGLTILCDPLAFTLYPALVIWYFLRKDFNLKKLFLTIIISILTIIPWTLRNYIVHKEFIPITTQFGVNFWIGNNPHATGTDYYRVYSIKDENYILMTQTLPRKTRLELTNMNEIEQSRFYMKEGIDFINQNPTKFLELLGKKFYYYWWMAPPGINASKDVAKHKYLLIIFYLPTLILGIYGILMSLKHKNIRMISLIIMLIIFIPSVYAIAHTGLMRYRLPLEPFLIMFAAFAIFNLLEWTSPYHSKS
jgi:4-amino-4-deoxy-L-arabinose transferase-like glycosyltransferase